MREDSEHPQERFFSERITDLLKSSIEIITEYRCKYHPGSVAMSVCEVCHADLCRDCSIIRGHRLVCKRCVGALDKAMGGTGPIAYLAKLLTHPFVVALALAAVLALAFVRLGNIQRKGLLRAIPADAVQSDRQFRLKLLLFAGKASRIEAYADSLYEIGRFEKAAREYERARAVYETLIDETPAREEQALFGLARAGIVEKMGEQSYAAGLYKNLATPTGLDRKYQVIAQLRLAKLQEQSEPEKAMGTYKNLLSDLRLVPDKLSAALSIMAHSDKAYRYDSQLHRLTHTDVDFDDIKAEALLRMGLLLLNMGREEEAQYRISRAASNARAPWLEKWASSELRKLRAFRQMRNSPDEPSMATEPKEKEKVVITHF